MLFHQETCDVSGAVLGVSRLLEKADPARQETLQREVIPDPMEGEQTWPTEEELAEADGQSTALVTQHRI